MIGLAGTQSTLEEYTMKKPASSCSFGPETLDDVFTGLLRKGARDLIVKAVECGILECSR